MGFFDDLDEVFNEEEVETQEITIKLASLGSVNDLTVEAGTTVADFKEANGLDGKKLVSKTRGVLTNSDVLEEDEILFVSASKENGKI